MTEHTKGRLHVGSLTDEPRRMSVGVDDESGNELGVIYKAEDARRILAAWNFCLGIPTAELERAAVIDEPKAAVHLVMIHNGRAAVACHVTRFADGLTVVADEVTCQSCLASLTKREV